MTKSFFNGKNRIIALAIWWMLWIVWQWNILIISGLNVFVAAFDSLLENLLLFASSWIVINNMRYYLPKKEKYGYTLITSLILSLASAIIAQIIAQLLFPNNISYLQLLRSTLFIRWAYGFLMLSSITLAGMIWYIQLEAQQQEAQQENLTNLAKEAELAKLRQQLQPHFLFNSLNSISALTSVQPEKARVMIQELSEFLRGTIRKEEQWNTLEEELSYMRLYLSIEQVRFGHRLLTNIQSNKNALPLVLPSLLIQPLVENAIKFGLYDTIGEVTISILAKVEKNYLIITVTNPYDAETANTLSGTGFGLTAIKRRLWLLFGRNDLLVIDKTNSRFSVTLQIPQPLKPTNA
ncbi:sensor histidine kinase [Hydrotalea sp.]|uniref:sensor histidine kinase n=1 Tax=Hydrotalea sp. TaxID=2881279 RepID=UPI003D09D955